MVGRELNELKRRIEEIEILKWLGIGKLGLGKSKLRLRRLIMWNKIENR